MPGVSWFPDRLGCRGKDLFDDGGVKNGLFSFLGPPPPPSLLSGPLTLFVFHPNSFSVDLFFRSFRLFKSDLLFYSLFHGMYGRGILQFGSRDLAHLHWNKPLSQKRLHCFNS